MEPLDKSKPNHYNEFRKLYGRIVSFHTTEMIVLCKRQGISR